MTEAKLAVNFFVALFALIDPIGNVPLFAAATLGAAAAGRRMVAAYIGLFMAGFLIFFYFTGVGLLAFFGISMQAFRIAGGIILFILGLDMVRDDFTTMFADAVLLVVSDSTVAMTVASAIRPSSLCTPSSDVNLKPSASASPAG